MFLQLNLGKAGQQLVINKAVSKNAAIDYRCVAKSANPIVLSSS